MLGTIKVLNSLIASFCRYRSIRQRRWQIGVYDHSEFLLQAVAEIVRCSVPSHLITWFLGLILYYV